jgi:hypothetical protein
VPDKDGKPTYVGYDGAVCLQLFEPWVVETYNPTTGTPVAKKILGPGNDARSLNNNGSHEKQLGVSVQSTETETRLNSTNLYDVYVFPCRIKYSCLTAPCSYEIAHNNGINVMLKDNGRDNFYVPSQTIVGYAGGEGPNG